MAKESGLGLDFLTQIINVQWAGGGVYVAGSQRFFSNPKNDVWANTIKTTEKLTNWEKTLSTATGGFMSAPFPGSGVWALMGDDPIFILTGAADNLETGGGSPGMMVTSEDGSTWASHNFGSFAVIYLVMWNKTDKALYAGMLDYSQVALDNTLFDVVLRSSDGLSWSEVERIPFVELYSSAIEKHCSDKVIDIHGHKVPTSVFGYDEDNDVLITPDPVNMTWGITYPAGEDFQHGDRLKIIRGPNNENAGTVTMALPAGMARVWAVGYAAGIWQAAGEAGEPFAHGVIATSVDDGNTWTITLVDVAGSSFANIAAGVI